MSKYLVGISGSISAYKSVLLIRELSKSNHECKVIITKGGQNFVTTELIAGLGVQVFTDDNINHSDPQLAMTHINLAKWANQILLIPASANLIAKLAHGFADDLLTQVILVAHDKSKIVAPAMNPHMWQNSVTVQNITKLRQLGYEVLDPKDGGMACGDIGTGRLVEINNILAYLHAPKALQNKTILISLGATVENIDGVRYLSNYSSGKMGVALIDAALNHGANVIAIAAKTDVTLTPQNNLKIYHASDTKCMLDLVMKHATNANAFISAAAVSDYRIKEPFNDKIKKSSDTLTLELVKNPDILANCTQKFPDLLCVGFALETNNLVKYATDKLKHKNLTMIVANHINVFGKDQSTVTIIDKQGNTEQINDASKSAIATRILDKIIKIM